MKKIAHISAILENPAQSQQQFNEIVSSYKHVVKGRMGLPLDEEDAAVISIVVVAEMDIINGFAGKLGRLQDVTVTLAVSKKEVDV